MKKLKVLRRYTGMKASLFAGCILLTPLQSAATDDNLIGFWSFRGGEAGTTVDTVTDDAEHWTGTAYKAQSNAGVKPTYADARPDAVIYSDRDKSSILCTYPQSLHFALATSGYAVGGYVDIDDLSGALAGRSAFTIEFWARIDDGYANPWSVPLCLQNDGRHVTPILGQGTPTPAHVKFGQYTTASDSFATINETGAYGIVLLNTWRHIAMVYSETDSAAHAGDLKCYIDYYLVGTLAYTNTAMSGSATALRLGTSVGYNRISSPTYNFRGDICALRVTSAALETSEMMSAGPDYSVPAGGTLGFWDFKDGTVGTSANVVTGRGDMVCGIADGEGAALTRSPDTGLVPVYDADAPGERIFASAAQSSANVLVKEPQSLKFTTTGEGTSTSADSSSVGGGLIRFPKLGSAISAQSDYTIECFFKDEDWSEWQWSSGLFGFYSRAGNAVVTNQAMVSSVKSGKTAWDVTVANANVKYTNDSTWKDGKWHHLALVYNGTARQLKLYVDYNPGGTVEYENGFNMDSDFVLGTQADGSSNYAFRGKISCLRVLPVALEPSGFMTYGNAPGLTIIVR